MSLEMGAYAVQVHEMRLILHNLSSVSNYEQEVILRDEDSHFPIIATERN